MYRNEPKTLLSSDSRLSWTFIRDNIQSSREHFTHSRVIHFFLAAIEAVTQDKSGTGP